MATLSSSERWRQRHIDYPLQGALAWALFGLLGLLPLDRASAFGGWLARTLGPLLPMHRRAARNLARAMPELSAVARAGLLAGMWDNLGRVLGEYPHLHRIWDPGPGGRVELVGAEILRALAEDGRPGILVGAHVGNWEILPVGAGRMGLPLTFVYRHANNPLADRLLARARERASADGRFLRKGREAARGMVQTLKAGGHVAMLADQRLSRGVPAPFFGREAMTTQAPAQFARAYACPVVPVRVERLEGARFRVTVEQPLAAPDTGDSEADDRALMAQVNRIFERWIRERPDQWLWMHRRWRD